MASLPYGRIDHHRVLRQLYLLDKYFSKNRYMFRRRTIHFSTAAINPVQPLLCWIAS
jgi:hypothetical protein